MAIGGPSSWLACVFLAPLTALWLGQRAGVVAPLLSADSSVGPCPAAYSWWTVCGVAIAAFALGLVSAAFMFVTAGFTAGALTGLAAGGVASLAVREPSVSDLDGDADASLAIQLGSGSASDPTGALARRRLRGGGAMA